MLKVLFVLILVIIITGCSTPGGQVTEQREFVLWSYSGKTGPKHWGALSEEYKTCAVGKSQSPVNLVGEVDMGLSPIEFYYLPAQQAQVTNNGHTAVVHYPMGSYIVIAGKRFDLTQLHFHTPSEHQIEGERKAMAAHLVHKAAIDGQIAVVAVLFEYGEENQALTPIWQSMPAISGDNRTITFDINNLLPAEKAYYSYTGSLTTPPCSENVIWNVLESSLTVSAAQANTFSLLFGENARPVQPLNERVIVITE